MTFSEVEALSVQIVLGSQTVPGQVCAQISPLGLTFWANLLNSVMKGGKYRNPTLHSNGAIRVNATAIVEVDFIVSDADGLIVIGSCESVCLGEGLVLCWVGVAP